MVCLIPLAYSYRNLIVRWRTTLMTATGFTLVVAALIVMFAFFNGVKKVCVASGEQENVIVLAQGNPDEVYSHLEVETIVRIEAAPGVARDEDGKLLASREMFVVMAEETPDGEESGFTQIRGVYPVALQVHTNVAISEGRLFRRNHREVIVGRSTANQLQLEVGQNISIGNSEWGVVGIFDADGASFESEVWADADQLARALHREGSFSSVVLRTISPSAAEAAVAWVKASRLEAVEVQTETSYYQSQAGQMNVLSKGAMVIVFFMAIGAVFGVTNTMFAAMSSRVGDLAIMQILGFSRAEILIAILIEALLIAVAGGVTGSLLGCLINGLSLNTGLGGRDLYFAFVVDWSILTLGLAFTFAMGLVGGTLPALWATRLEPLQSLR